jgi:hypothetical protein
MPLCRLPVLTILRVDDTHAGESDAQRRHVQMLTSLFGEWSDIIQDMHNTGLNQEALQLVVRPFHTRVSEVRLLRSDAFACQV